MKKIKGDKPSGIIIHSYIELSQGNSLCTNIYVKLKYHAFHHILSLFSSTKWENRRKEQDCQCGRAGSSGRGEVLRKGCRRVNIMQQNVYTCKQMQK
jgi:hypothetical protein